MGGAQDGVPDHANVKLREVADAVMAAATGKPMPTELQDHLAAAVQAQQAGHEYGSSGPWLQVADTSQDARHGHR